MLEMGKHTCTEEVIFIGW